MRGLLGTPVQQVDPSFSREVKEHLFAQHLHAMGLDLISINIQRGRDHGIAPYSAYRRYCEDKYKVRARFRNERVTSLLVKSLYGDLDKLDLFLGGMLEEPVHGGLLGPTFSCIVGEQVTDLLFIYRISLYKC